VNIVILDWWRSLWEGDKEVMKRSGRNEPVWVAIYICMEAMIGICLYSYLYLKLAKTVFLIIFYVFLKQIWRTRVQNPGNRVGGWGEVAQTMYTHVSKCRHDKIK
jgi:hypothetical protein